MKHKYKGNIFPLLYVYNDYFDLFLKKYPTKIRINLWCPKSVQNLTKIRLIAPNSNTHKN